MDPKASCLKAVRCDTRHVILVARVVVSVADGSVSPKMD
jgi:hypothetical protein